LTVIHFFVDNNFFALDNKPILE